MSIRSPDEAWQAGWDAAAAAPPLTEDQVIWAARLMGRDQAPDTADAA
jgi:hypothetical protein